MRNDAIVARNANGTADTGARSHLNRTVNSEKQEDGWLATAFAFIPIIPERNMNKAGALAWYGGVLAGQGLAYNAQMYPGHVPA